jgi:hypothetical protein
MLPNSVKKKVGELHFQDKSGRYCPGAKAFEKKEIIPKHLKHVGAGHASKCSQNNRK